MGANSILTNLTAENTVSEIKLLLGADYAKKKTVVLLEGEDDLKVFRFLVSKEVTLIKAYGASTTVDKLMPQHFADEKRVIGIRDRDYQEKKKFERIFYCDYCNCEMMLVSDDETFEKTTVNFYRGKLLPLQLRREILEKLFPLSVIRKCSERFRWALRISNTDLAKIISPRFKPTRKQTVDFVNSYNHRNPITPEKEKRLNHFKPSGRTEDYLMITNGHDFIEAFRIYCTESAANSNKRRSISDKMLSGALRCSYSLSAFQKTQLYSELKAYGDEHNLNIVRE